MDTFLVIVVKLFILTHQYVFEANDRCFGIRDRNIIMIISVYWNELYVEQKNNKKLFQIIFHANTVTTIHPPVQKTLSQ